MLDPVGPAHFAAARGHFGPVAGFARRIANRRHD